MKLGDTIQTTRIIYFYPNHNQNGAMIGKPQARATGTRATICRIGGTIDRALIRTHSPDGFWAWIDPDDIELPILATT